MDIAAVIVYCFHKTVTLFKEEQVSLMPPLQVILLIKFPGSFYSIPDHNFMLGLDLLFLHFLILNVLFFIMLHLSTSLVTGPPCVDLHCSQIGKNLNRQHS